MIAPLAVLRDRTPCLVRVSSELREKLWRHSPAAVLQHCDMLREPRRSKRSKLAENLFFLAT